MGDALMRAGFALVEVMLALTLVMVQAPALVAGVSLAAALVRAGDAALADLPTIVGVAGCTP
jgi:type II secretory pathway component PulJ